MNFPNQRPILVPRPWTRSITVICTNLLVWPNQLSGHSDFHVLITQLVRVSKVGFNDVYFLISILQYAPPLWNVVNFRMIGQSFVFNLYCTLEIEPVSYAWNPPLWFHDISLPGVSWRIFIHFAQGWYITAGAAVLRNYSFSADSWKLINCIIRPFPREIAELWSTG